MSSEPQVMAAEATADTEDFPFAEREAMPLARVEPQQQRPRQQQVLPPADDEADEGPRSGTRLIVQHSRQIHLLAAALAKAQGAFTELKRTKKSKINLKGGGGYEHEYETLSDVIAATQPALSANEIAVLQLPFTGERAFTLRTMLVHSSGQWLCNDLACASFSYDPQSIGNGTTYLMRYARKAILGISADWDDDEEALSRQQNPQSREQVRPASRVSAQQQRPAPPEAQPATRPQAAAQPAPAAAAAPAPAAALPPNIGAIASIAGDDTAAGVTLATGFKAGTRDPEVIRSLRAFKATNATVELRVTQRGDPSKVAPLIDEVVLRRRDGSPA